MDAILSAFPEASQESGVSGFRVGLVSRELISISFGEFLREYV